MKRTFQPPTPTPPHVFACAYSHTSEAITARSEEATVSILSDVKTFQRILREANCSVEKITLSPMAASVTMRYRSPAHCHVCKALCVCVHMSMHSHTRITRTTVLSGMQLSTKDDSPQLLETQHIRWQCGQHFRFTNITPPARPPTHPHKIHSHKQAYNLQTSW